MLLISNYTSNILKCSLLSALLLLRYPSLLLLLLLLLTHLLLLTCLPSLTPVTHIAILVSILVYAQPMLLVFHKLPVIHIALWLPLQTQAMLKSLIQIFRLPSSEVSLTVEVPNQTDVPGDYHGAVGVSLNN